MKISYVAVLAALLLSTEACSPKKEGSISSTQYTLRNFAFDFARDVAKGDTTVLKRYLGQNASHEAVAAVERVCSARDSTIKLLIKEQDITIKTLPNGSSSITIPFSITAPPRTQYEGRLTASTKRNAFGDYKIIDTSDDISFYIGAAEQNIANARKASALRLAREEKLVPARVEAARQRIRLLYDSVVYYTLIDTTLLFYVANGDWQYPMFRNEASPHDFRMGVVDEYGQEIVPVSFDKIYNPGGTVEGCIEVERDQKRGLYTLNGHSIVSTSFEALYPYRKDPDVLVQVKLDGRFGWINQRGTLFFDPKSHPDYQLFASPLVGKRVHQWKYDIFQPGLSYLGHPYHSHDDFMAGGILVSPSYLNDLRVVPEYNWNIPVDGIELDGIIMEDNHVSVVDLASISKEIKGLVTLFVESGIDARDYHFQKNNLVTFDEQASAISSIEFDGSFRYYLPHPELPFRDALFETRELKTSAYLPYDEMTQYSYYQIGADGEITTLETSRIFPFTKFVRIGEEHFRGTFRNYIEMTASSRRDQVNLVTSYHLTQEDLDVMRNEIFAEYGYRFQSEKWKTYFARQPWYTPRYDNVDPMLTDIDRYNIRFIHHFQQKMQDHEADYIQRDSTLYLAAG